MRTIYIGTCNNEHHIVSELSKNNTNLIRLNIAFDEFGTKKVNIILDFLTSEDCMIKNIQVTFGQDILQHEFEYIMNVIVNCKNLYKLIIYTNNNDADMCIKKFMPLLKNHNNLKRLDLSYLQVNSSIQDIVKYKPFTLTHIYLRYNFKLDAQSLEYLIKYGNMRLISVIGNDLVNRCNIDANVFNHNTSILTFSYLSFRKKNLQLDNSILNMLKRNNDAINKSSKIACCLIALRKYRRINYLKNTPIDIIKIIAKYIIDSYIDDEWR